MCTALYFYEELGVESITEILLVLGFIRGGTLKQISNALPISAVPLPLYIAY